MKTPVAPPRTAELINAIWKATDGPERMAKTLTSGLGPAPEGKYRHWDTFRHVAPPGSMTSQDAWLAIKLARLQIATPLPVHDRHGRPFTYGLPAPALEMLHRIDRDASGTIQVSEQVTDPQTRDTYLLKSLTEEAITSSQLEGASTTRKVAKEMLQSGREPKDRSERMILNNYRAMQFMRSRSHDDLTPAMVLELHRIVTAGTLDDPDGAGRLRLADENIVVADETGRLLHLPPDAGRLEQRMRDLCAFANEDQSSPFVHPVVRAIVLHFWLGYDHPFVDGNGRTARVLFYWSLARSAYWLCEFTSISRILKHAPSKYALSYLYTETDDNDFTYFLLHQLKVLCRAIEDLHTYLARKQEELHQTNTLLQRHLRLRHSLNARQLALVNHALKEKEAQYTIASHRRSHNVSFETARTDLMDLRKRGFITQRKHGRVFVYEPVHELLNKVNSGQLR